MGTMTDERLAQLRHNPLPYTDDDGQEIVVRGADDWRDLLAHIDALTADNARLRGKLDALVTAWDAHQAACRDWQRGELSDEAFDIAAGKWRSAAEAARAAARGGE